MSSGDYNDEPVYYCHRCLSLRVMYIAGAVSEYCDDCGSTDIGKCSIGSWEELYKKANGRRFLDNGYGRE